MADPLPSSGLGRSPHVNEAWSLKDVNSARTFYDNWCPKYDADLSSEGYASPRRAVEALVAYLPSSSPHELRILDAGCGTGLVGGCLKASSLGDRPVIDGMDLSEGMLIEARKKEGVYRGLKAIDMNSALHYKDDAFDAVLCVGTLTMGHVGPAVLGEFVRVVRQAGLVVATIHGSVWESGGYAREVRSLARDGKVNVVSTARFGITERTTEDGVMLILRKR